jgi:membrane-bound serine protease (ClpP class)
MVDVNVVYMILIFGLWAAVTAAYIPGTGGPEVLALIGVAGGIILLTSLPTNWAGVIILFIGVMSFLLIPFLNNRWARLAEGGLILQIVGTLMMFNGVQVSLLLLIVTVGLSVLYHHGVLLPFLEKNRKQVAVIDDSRHLIGQNGRVVKSSEKVGANYMATVNVRGEQWTALADHPLRTGDEIVVMEREGLQLQVEGVKHKQKTRKEEEETTEETRSSS